MHGLCVLVCSCRCRRFSVRLQCFLVWLQAHSTTWQCEQRRNPSQTALLSLSTSLLVNKHTGALTHPSTQALIYIFSLRHVIPFLLCQLQALRRFLLSIKPHRPFALVGRRSREWWADSSCQSETRHLIKSWSSLMESTGRFLSNLSTEYWTFVRLVMQQTQRLIAN